MLGEVSASAPPRPPPRRAGEPRGPDRPSALLGLGSLSDRPVYGSNISKFAHMSERVSVTCERAICKLS